jgi:hypothetical protein
VDHGQVSNVLRQEFVMRLLVALILNLSLFAGSTLADGFGFGGLNFKTTAEELKKRYPRSFMVGNYMYLSEAESHDHIYGIEIPGGNPGGRMRLAFERSQSPGSPHNARYPSCQKVLSMIQPRYGSPGKVEEFAEESSWNRRYSWIQEGELLALHCFRVNGKTFLAEALTITKSAQ